MPAKISRARRQGAVRARQRRLKRQLNIPKYTVPKKPRKPAKYSRRVDWPRRAQIMDRYIGVVFRNLERKGQLSSAHNPGHAQRTSMYAQKYVTFMGAGPAIQQQARIAGVSHDRIGYPTEKISHEEASGKVMGEKIKGRYGKTAEARITAAIATHGKIACFR